MINEKINKINNMIEELQESFFIIKSDINIKKEHDEKMELLQNKAEKLYLDMLSWRDFESSKK